MNPQRDALERRRRHCIGTVFADKVIAFVGSTVDPEFDEKPNVEPLTGEGLDHLNKRIHHAY